MKINITLAVGRERCYRVSWALPTLPPPEADNLDPQEAVQSVVEGSGEGPLDALQRKDANEVLVKDGPEALRQCIDLAEPLPIRGLFRSLLHCFLTYIMTTMMPHCSASI